MALRLERGSDPASWSEERGEGEGCMAVGLGEGSGRNSGRGVAGCWRGGGLMMMLLCQIGERGRGGS